MKPAIKITVSQLYAAAKAIGIPKYQAVQLVMEAVELARKAK